MKFFKTFNDNITRVVAKKKLYTRNREMCELMMKPPIVNDEITRILFLRHCLTENEEIKATFSHVS